MKLPSEMIPKIEKNDDITKLSDELFDIKGGFL